MKVIVYKNGSYVVKTHFSVKNKHIYVRNFVQEKTQLCDKKTRFCTGKTHFSDQNRCLSGKRILEKSSSS
jgi:hypothetical protein